MMRGKVAGLAALILFSLTSVSVNSEVVSEVTFGGGFTDNLFNDSSATNDIYAAISPRIKIYPSSSVEFSLGGSYTSYIEYSDLSNIFGEVGLSVIPTNEASPTSLLLSGFISGRGYGEAYKTYNTFAANGAAMFSHRLGPKTMFRGGVSAGLLDYSNMASGDNDGLTATTGINFTPFGSNSFDLEVSYNSQRYTTSEDTTVIEHSGNRPPTLSFDAVKSTFQVLAYSARISRPLSQRTGLSATFSERRFTEAADFISYGFRTDILSPWASLWDGWSLAANIKNFPGHQLILEWGATYTDKEFIKRLDVTDGNDGSLQSRNDERAGIYFSVQRPITTSTNKLIRPTLQVQYVDNTSDVPEYDYSYFDVSVGLSVRW